MIENTSQGFLSIPIIAYVGYGKMGVQYTWTTMIERTVPIRLDSTSNMSEHWSNRSRRNKANRARLWHALPRGLEELLDSGRRAYVTLTRVAPRPLDDDNLRGACKGCRDIIAQMFFPDTKPGQADSYDCFEWIYAQERGAVKEYALRVRIELKEDECESQH